MMTPKEEIVTVPNAVVVSAKVITYSRRDERIDAQISACVTIGYDVPWRQIHGLLLQAAGATAGLRPDPRPYVVQTALSDFYVEYELRAKLEQSAQRFSVQSDLYAAIQDAFNDAGVQIMSPHFESQPPQKVYVPRSTWFAPPAIARTVDRTRWIGEQQADGQEEDENDRSDHDRLLRIRHHRRDRSDHDGAHGAGCNSVVRLSGHVPVRCPAGLSRARAQQVRGHGRGV
jgi:hypothetical protein